LPKKKRGLDDPGLLFTQPPLGAALRIRRMPLGGPRKGEKGCEKTVAMGTRVSWDDPSHQGRKGIAGIIP